MLDKNVLIWLLLAVIFVGCAWWHVRENQRLARKWRGDFDADSAERLVRFAWMRTAQLMYVLVCAIIVIIVYNRELNEARLASAVQNTPAEIVQPPQAAIKQPQPLPQQNRGVIQPKPAAPLAAPVKDSYYPPLVAAPAKPMAAQNPAATVDDVYNPEKKNAGNESAIDAIKKRYEDILVTYMFLKQCGRTGTNDYPIIISALAQEMASVNAPGRMQYDVITAAQGSYKEMYSQSRCDGPEIGNLAAQYAAYIGGLSNNVTAH